MLLRIGDTFAGYRVLRLLGSGGMGEVYLVQHPRLPRQEALKVLRPDISSDPSFRERFIREADLAAGLRHPHVVGIHDRGEHDGQLWIAMDYIDGTDLAHLSERRYPEGIPVGHVLAIVSAVASALDYAHNRGLLHRDVKPANIIVSDLDTDDASIFLADFGIARPMDDTSGITTTNMTVGTVAYAAPEQLMGEAMDGRADQYALAATTYHLLTGAQLFPNSNPAVVISRHLNAPAPVLADIRPELASLDPVLAAALAKNSDDRFASSSDFARALTEAAGPQNVRGPAAPTTPAPAARRSHLKVQADDGSAQGGFADSSTRKLIGVSVAAVVLLVCVTGMLWRPWQHLQSGTAASSSSSPPTTTQIATAAAPSTSSLPRPPNPAGEEQFLTEVHAKIPTADIPGGRPTDTRLIAYGYQACGVMEKYLNPSSAADPFYDQVSRDAGFTRDPAKIDKTNAAFEVWFMTLAAQHLCNAPATAQPPSAPNAPTSMTSVEVTTGLTIGDQCDDWMKFTIDPVSGQEMICTGYPDNLSRGESTKWYSAQDDAVGPAAGWANAPRVGRTGSSCSGEVPFTTGRSSDGYAVWCSGGPGAYMPGTTPTWTVYRP